MNTIHTKSLNSTIAVAVVLLLVVVSFGQVQADNNTNTATPDKQSQANPALDMFNSAITFYASFDGHATADMSNGAAKPTKGAKELKWADGLFGKKALVARKQSIYYSPKDNIDLSHDGALILWIKTEKWQGSKNKHPKQIEFLDIHNHGLTLYLARGGWKAQPIEAILGPNVNKKKTRSLVIKGSSHNWTKSKWHLLALNWNSGHIELSIDGSAFKRGGGKAGKPSAAQDKKPGFMRFAAGATKKTPYLMQALMILNRPLTSKEIKKLYKDSTSHTVSKRPVKISRQAKRSSLLTISVTV